MIKVSAYGHLSFLPFLIPQNFEALFDRLSRDLIFDSWKYRVGRCHNLNRFMRMDIYVLLLKLFENERRCQNLNRFMRMDIYVLLLKLFENERRYYILFSKFEKEHIIFYLIWFILCILEQVFQMAPQKYSPSCDFRVRPSCRYRIGGV